MFLDPDASLFALAILLAFARVYGTPTLTCDEAYRWVNTFHQQLLWLESSLDLESSRSPWVRSACMLVQRGDLRTCYSVARLQGSVRGRLRVNQVEEPEASCAQLAGMLGPKPARAASLLSARSMLSQRSLIVAADRLDTLFAAVGSTAIEAGRRAWEAVRRGDQWTLVVDCPDGQAAGALRPRCLIAPGGAPGPATELLRAMAAETGSWFAVADQAEAMNTPRPPITQGGVQHDSRDTSHRVD